MPVTVLGLTLARSISRLLLLRLWSSRSEYRLVPSKTGKLPPASPASDKSRATRAHGAEALQDVGKPAHAGRRRRSEPAPWPRLPFTAMPRRRTRQHRIRARLPAHKPDSGSAAPAARAGFVRNADLVGSELQVQDTGRRAEVVSKRRTGTEVCTKSVLPDAGESRLVPPRDFVGEIVIGLVLLDRPAERRARLHARVGRIGNRAERIHRLKIAVAQDSRRRRRENRWIPSG